MKNKLLLTLLLGLFLMSFASASWNATLDNGLVAFWRFNENTGTSAQDSATGSIHNLTGSGTPGWTSSGKIGNATDLDSASSEYWSRASGDLFPAWEQPYTFNLWYKPESTSADHFILSKSPSASVNYQRYGIRMNGVAEGGNKDFDYLVHNSAGAQSTARSTTKASAGNWYMISIRYDGGTNMTIWINGVQEGTAQIASYRNDGESAFNLGKASYSTAHYTNGIIDMVSYHNRSLSSGEILQMYNEGNGLENIASEPESPTELFNYSYQSDNSSATYPTNNDSVGFNIFLQSNVSLEGLVFSTNESGTWTNDTVVDLGGLSGWANISRIINYPKNTIVGWLMYINNSETWISTNILTYVIRNSLPLIVGIPTLNDTSVFQNDSVKISVEVSDEDGLTDIDSVIAEINNGSSRVGTINLSKLNYTKYPDNPINMTHDKICSDATGTINGETSFWYKDGVIHSIYRICEAEESNILYANSTDGVNFTYGVNLTLDGNTTGFYAYTLPGVTEYNGSYYMTAGLQPGALDQFLFKANTTNPRSWTKACSGDSQILTGTLYNAEILWDTINNSNGTELGMFISSGGGSSFQINYYNTTDLTGCSGWTSQGAVLASAEGTWSIYKNNKWIVYYSDRWANATGEYVTSVAVGDIPSSLTPTRRGILIGSQAWESPGASSIIGAIEVMILPEEAWGDFDHKFYAYYDGSQNITGTAYDSLGRSFDEAHFNIIQGNYSNLTLSQEGSSSIWSGVFTNTSEIKTYNLTSLWINDGDAVNYSSYGNISFTVSEFADADLSVTPTYPDNLHIQDNNTVNFISTVELIEGTNPATLSNVSLYINGTLNQTNTSGIEGTYNFEVEFGDNYYSWYVIAINNESTSSQSNTRTFEIDTTNPFINATLESETIFDVGANVTLNYNITDANLDSCWYEYNSINTSLDCEQSQINITTVHPYLNITVFANDTAGNLNQSDVLSFEYDTVPPSINVSYPTGTEDYFRIGNNETLNYSINDTNLESCWYQYDGVNNTLNCSLTSIEFEYTLNNNEIFVYANDSLGNLQVESSTWVYRVIDVSRNYQTSSLTTTLESFYLNFTTSSEVIPVVYLEYDGVEYLSTRTGNTTNHQIYNEITIETTGEKQFRWKITYDTYTIYTENSSQSVNEISSLSFIGGACGAGLTQVMNFTFGDEQNLTALSEVTAKFNFQFGVSEQSGSSAYGQITNTSQVSVCINTSESPTYQVGYGEIEYEKSGYSSRRFYVFENTRLSNQTINTTLYMLSSSDATSFLIEARSPTLEPYVNKYTSLLRWYPAENEYKIVEMGKTDDKGQTVKKIKIEDVDYRIGVYELDGSLIYIINPIRMVCLATPCSYTINVPTSSANQFDEVYGIEAEIVYTSGVFTLTYNDPSQNTEVMSLQVYRIGGTSNTLLCESNGTSFTGILNCNVSEQSGLLKAIAVRTASPERPIASLMIDTETTVFTGTFGLFIQFLIVVVLAFLGIISPVIAIITSIIALLFGVLLFKTMTYPILVGIAVLGGIIIHMMKRQ